MRTTLRTTLVALTAALALATSSGCYTVNATLPGTLRGDVKPDQTEKVGSLAWEDTHWYFLWGLVGAPPEDYLAAEIKKQVQARGADGVTNFTYDAQFGCVDLILGTCTCGIIAPRTYKMSGDIVRIKPAPLPGKPAKAADAGDTQQAPNTAVAQRF